MKIGIAQINPVKGDIFQNIQLHKECIALALSNNADAIFFSELSITGYEPELAGELKMELHDSRLEVFQHISNSRNIIIGIGAPTAFREDVEISMILFQPNQMIQKYSKQILHEDEKPYFIRGDKPLLIRSNGLQIAPAICYESLQLSHIEQAIALGASIYIASVAKAQTGINKAYKYFPAIAKEKSIPILLVNSIGFCDNFDSKGHSAIWDNQGKLLGQLAEEEGILIYDTEEESVLELRSNHH